MMRRNERILYSNKMKKDINSCSTLFCNWIRVFTTQIGLLNVTAVAPAKILLVKAFSVGDIVGKWFSRNGFEDSYLFY